MYLLMEFGFVRADTRVYDIWCIFTFQISPRHAEQVEYMTTSEVENFTRVVILDKFGVKY